MNQTDDLRELLVCASPCSECLFSKNKIVSERRKAELLADCEKNEVAFICHKHSIRALESQGVEASRAGRVACHNHFKKYEKALLIYRLARLMKRVVFVDEQGREVGDGHK